MSDRLIAMMRRARRITVEIAPGKRVYLLRPREEETLAIWRAGAVTPEVVCASADGWEGIDEADLVGAENGSDSPVEFSADLWREYVLDRLPLLSKCIEAIGKSINDHFSKARADEKN